MKRIFTFVCVFCLVCTLCLSVSGGALAAGNEYAAAAELVADIATTQYFTDEAVNDADIELIVQAGLNAPSAMNGQPWHFSVITDAAVLLIGHEDSSVDESIDGYTGATARNPINDMVSYVKG